MGEAADVARRFVDEYQCRHDGGAARRLLADDVVDAPALMTQVGAIPQAA